LNSYCCWYCSINWLWINCGRVLKIRKKKKQKQWWVEVSHLENTFTSLMFMDNSFFMILFLKISLHVNSFHFIH